MYETLNNLVKNEEYYVLDNLQPSYFEENLDYLMSVAILFNKPQMIHYIFKRACVYYKTSLSLFQTYFNQQLDIDVSSEYINMCDWHKNHEIFRLFFNAKMTLDTNTQFYHLCQFTKSLEVYQAFFSINTNFSLSCKNNNNETFLHFICHDERSIDVFRLCFKYQANRCLTIQDYKGRIPFHYVCMSQREPDIYKLVLNDDPAIYANIVDIYNKTPLDYINEYTSKNVVAYLIKTVVVSRRIIRLFAWHYPRIYLIFRWKIALL